MQQENQIEQDTWEITKQYVTLYKDDVEVASGFICYSIYINTSEGDREEEASVMIYNGKEFNDYDHDKTQWDEEREIYRSKDYDELISYYKEIINDLITEGDEIKNENGANIIHDGNHGVYFKFNKLNGKIHGLKEMFCKKTLLMTSNYSNGELDGIQTTYCSKAYNRYEMVNSPIHKVEIFKKGKLQDTMEFLDLNSYFHSILDEVEAQNDFILNFQNELIQAVIKKEITRVEAKSKLLLTIDDSKIKKRTDKDPTKNPSFIYFQNQLIIDKISGKINPNEVRSKLNSFESSLY